MSPTSFDRDLVLIAADFNERRLLYGELLEAGYDVLPVTGFAVALGLLLKHAVVPRLVLLDVQGDEHATPQSVEHLAAQVPDARILVLVGAIDRALWEPLETRVAAVLHRPITIGRTVETVKAFLSPPERPRTTSSD